MDKTLQDQIALTKQLFFALIQTISTLPIPIRQQVCRECVLDFLKDKTEDELCKELSIPKESWLLIKAMLKIN